MDSNWQRRVGTYHWRLVGSLIGLICIIGLLIGALGLVSDQFDSGPIYTAAQIRVLIAKHPQQWIGRTVSVRGQIVDVLWMQRLTVRSATNNTKPFVLPSVVTDAQTAHHCIPSIPATCTDLSTFLQYPPALSIAHFGFASETGAPGGDLIVRTGTDASLWQLFRRLPMLDRLIAPAYVIRWGSDVIYHLRIIRDPVAPCHIGVCDDAVIVGSGPQ